MATHYSSGQYEDAYIARNLQNWSLPRVSKEHPSAREGYTQFIANDRGHLLPSIPRSKDSPWGTYMSTWDMPLKIPPAKVNLTSRSINAAAHLTEWIDKSMALSNACNGFCPQVTGKPSNPPERIAKETSARGQPSAKGAECPCSAGKMLAEKGIEHRGTTTLKGPLSRQPGCIDIRLKEDDASPDAKVSQQLETKEQMRKRTSEIPISRQPGSMDVRLKEAVSPKVPSPSRPGSRESTPRRAVSADASPSGWPRSVEGKPKGVNTPVFLASYRTGSMEANPRSSHSPEAMPSSQPVTKGSQDLEVRKTPMETDVDRREKGGSARPPSHLEERSS